MVETLEVDNDTNTNSNSISTSTITSTRPGYQLSFKKVFLITLLSGLTVFVILWTEFKGSFIKRDWPISTKEIYLAYRNLNLTFKELPGENQTITTIAFGSCAKQVLSDQSQWDTLLHNPYGFTPDLTIFMGDNVYGDCNDGNDNGRRCDELLTAYLNLGNEASFRRFAKVIPIVATLDDHDYGKPDASRNNIFRDIARFHFYSFFDLYERELKRTLQPDGVYQRYEWGAPGQRLQVLLLDTRHEKDTFLVTDEPWASRKEVYMEDTNSTKQILSPKQWQWLRTSFQRPADLRLVVSSIQVLSNGTGFECWRMISPERQRLIDLIKDSSETIGGTTLILSGDRHVGGFYKYNNIYEVTASSWTHTRPANESCASNCDEVDNLRLFDFVHQNNFGGIEVDWSLKRARLTIRSSKGSESGIGEEVYRPGRILQNITIDI